MGLQDHPLGPPSSFPEACTPGPPSSFPEACHDPPQHPNPCAPSCASLRSAAWWRARAGSPVGDCPGCTESSAGLKSIKNHVHPL